ncbi:MAG: T9SS type A sorting domain-containing protein [Bacteroidia bacterium]|nr:T9SS type A sorting domain-containing protein [Bacteroidia bacterium]
MKRKITLLCLAATTAVTMKAQVMLQENFTSTFNASAAGWTYQNNTPTTGQSWFQGNPSVFNAYNGAPADYLACNWASCGNNSSPETISNWLITPTVTLVNGGVLEFASRTSTNPATFPDRLEVYYSLGSGTNVGNTSTSLGTFSTLIVSVNPSLTTTGYPGTWTLYTNALTGLSGPTVGRIAFRYHVTNGGPASSAANSDFIGLDAVKYSVPCGVSVSSYTICSGGTATLSAIGGTTNTTYTWSPVSGSVSSIVVSPTATSVYTLSYSEGSNICPDKTATVTIGSQLSMNVVASANTVCLGSAATLSVISSATTYSWSTGATSPVITVTPTGASTTYSVGGLSGLCFGGNTIAISTVPLPTVTAVTSPSLSCPDSDATLTASGASSYVWDLSGSPATTNPLLVNAPSVSGVYTVGVKGSSAFGCVSNLTIINLTVVPSPTVVASISRSSACTNETVSLNASGANTYAWSGSTTSALASLIYTTGTVAGNKTFTLIGIDANGCSDTTNVTLSVSLCTGIEKVNGNGLEASAFPNPFTNELNLSGIVGKIEIYNALGQVVVSMSTNDSEKINTSELPKGAYILKAYAINAPVRTIKLLKN